MSIDSNLFYFGIKEDAKNISDNFQNPEEFILGQSYSNSVGNLDQRHLFSVEIEILHNILTLLAVR